MERGVTSQGRIPLQDVLRETLTHTHTYRGLRCSETTLDNRSETDNHARTVVIGLAGFTPPIKYDSAFSNLTPDVWQWGGQQSQENISFSYEECQKSIPARLHCLLSYTFPSLFVSPSLFPPVSHFNHSYFHNYSTIQYKGLVLSREERERTRTITEPQLQPPTLIIVSFSETTQSDARPLPHISLLL